MIKEKIANGEGFVEIETLGLITAQEYNQLTDPQWDSTLDQSKVNSIKSESDILDNKLQNELAQLKSDIENIKLEYETSDIINAKQCLRELETKIKQKLEKGDIKNPDNKSDDVIIRETNDFWMFQEQVFKLIRPIDNRLKAKQKEIAEKQKEVESNLINTKKRIKEIKEDFNNARKSLNPDYEKNINLKILWKPTQHDYKIVNDELVLLTDEEKLEVFREKYKQDITRGFQSKYPSVIVDNQLQNDLKKLLDDIDKCSSIKEIKEYKIV